MHEALERYNAVWDAYDLVYFLYHEPEGLIKNGYKVSSPQELGDDDGWPENSKEE